MSVYYQNLVVYGWELEYDAIDPEAYADYRYDDREVGDAVVVADAMGGDYLFVGILQARSDPSHSGRVTFDTQELSTPTAEQMNALSTLCDDVDIDPLQDPSRYVFTHYW